MKRILLSVFSLGLLLGCLLVQAQEGINERKKYEFVKQKDISKTYPASGNKLLIENSFGHVKLLAWTRNEIKVDVHIEASSNQEDFAQKIFDAISVTDKQQGNDITFKTSIENNKNNECKNCKSSMIIDYEIHLPVSVALDLKNSFGNTEIPDYTGALSVVNKFGELTAGALSNVKKVSIEYGIANIKSLSNTDATFKFSQIDIGNLSGKNKISLEFCEATRINLNNNLESLNLNESYSIVNLRTGNLSASYNVSTNFGEFVDRTYTVKRTDTPSRYGPDSNRKYEGKSGSGNAKIEIRSNFGRIILGEATADDMKDKSKNNKRGAGTVHI
jgi:hypothetical protein